MTLYPRRMNMKRTALIRWSFLGLLTLFVALALTGAGLAADTIKLGIAGAHSGDLASYGLPSVKAAELVVKDINARGGILGKKVELLIEDDACKPEMATNTATKLVPKSGYCDGTHLQRRHQGGLGNL